jgi:hypothetical protein
MATRKKGESGKRVARRVSPEAPTPKEAKKTADPDPEPEKSRIPERIQEKDSGFGVIKIVVGVVVVLIIGVSVLSQYSGGAEGNRGDRLQGESCDSTQECRQGSICFPYKDGPRRCYATCNQADSTCEPGLTCVSTSTSMGRKKTHIRSICVDDAEAR